MNAVFPIGFIILLMSKIAVKSESKLSDSRSINRSSLIEIDKKYALMEMSSQRQVTSQLENQLDYLLGKKERQALKKKKLQELQELYEKERENRKSRISFKISRSDKNRESNINQRKNRTKSQLETVQKVKKKVQHDNEQQLSKMAQLQKQLSHRKTLSRSSKTSLSANKTMREHSRYLKITSSKSNQIDSQIQKIESKINQAKSNSLLFHNQMAEKAKSFSKNCYEIMDKIKAEELKEETKCYKDYYHRATHILECQDKSKSFYQRESDRKRKNIDQKFSRANQNLKEIDKRRQAKLQELQVKFNKSFAPKTWKNQKNELYLSKFFKNQQQIEHQKTLKAQSILKKHFDQSLKNKALRQKKDRILQTVKKIEY